MSDKKVWGDQDKHIEIIKKSMGEKEIDPVDWYPDDMVTMYRGRFYDYGFKDLGDEMPAAGGEWRKCGNQGPAAAIRKVLWVKYKG